MEVGLKNCQDWKQRDLLGGYGQVSWGRRSVKMGIFSYISVIKINKKDFLDFQLGYCLCENGFEKVYI